MTSKSMQAEPSNVSVEDGEVIQEGADGLAISYTPDAAEVTGNRLKQGAGQARRKVKPTLKD